MGCSESRTSVGAFIEGRVGKRLRESCGAGGRGKKTSTPTSGEKKGRTVRGDAGEEEAWYELPVFCSSSRERKG